MSEKENPNEEASLDLVDHSIEEALISGDIPRLARAANISEQSAQRAMEALPALSDDDWTRIRDYALDRAWRGNLSLNGSEASAKLTRRSGSGRGWSQGLWAWGAAAAGIASILFSIHLLQSDPLPELLIDELALGESVTKAVRTRPRDTLTWRDGTRFQVRWTPRDPAKSIDHLSVQAFLIRPGNALELPMTVRTSPSELTVSGTVGLDSELPLGRSNLLFQVVRRGSELSAHEVQDFEPPASGLRESRAGQFWYRVLVLPAGSP